MSIKRRAVRACALAVLIGGVPAAPAAADPAITGAWSALEQYPVTPVSAGVLPDGRIVAWDQANQAPYFPEVPHSGRGMILDPATGTITRTANVAPSSLFCSLLTSLPDGRLAIIGGGNGDTDNPQVQIFDGGSKTFSVAGEMQKGRWYPGGDLTATGDVVVGGGTATGIEDIDQQTGLGTLRNDTLPANWYPDFLRMPDGRFTIEDVGDLREAQASGVGAGRYTLGADGSLTPIADQTLLKERQRGVRTSIGPYKLFYNGGGTSTESMIIDVSSGTPHYTAAASSRLPHMTGEAITLPTGDVLAIGGNSDGVTTNGDDPVLTPELYDVVHNSWSSMADTARQRQYHSVAALLPDGRVWSAGSSYGPMQEPNGQFFSPTYLFKHDGSGERAVRPTATDAPSSVKAGATFSVATGDPSDITSAALIRMAATTHQLNVGQAYVPLSVTPEAGRVRMTAPGGGEAPPGYYMVFLLDRAGVPSIAPIVRLRPGDSTVLPPRAVQSSQDGREWGASEAFDGVVGNAAGAAGSVTRTESEDEPWWEVDLGEHRDLDRVTVNLRTDSGVNRDLWVFASDDPILDTTVAGARAQAGVTAVHLLTPTGTAGTVALQRTARYIRVQSPDDSTVLSLGEVVPVVLPGTPAVTATAASDTRIDLSWGDVGTDTGYRLQQSTTSGFGAATTTDLPADTTSRAITGLNAGTRYFFRLRALNGAAASPWSPTASTVTKAAPVSTPSPSPTPTATAGATTAPTSTPTVAATTGPPSAPTATGTPARTVIPPQPTATKTTAPAPTSAPPKRSDAAYASAVESDRPVAWWRLADARGHHATNIIGGDPGAYRNGVRLGQPGLLPGDPLNTAAGFDGVDDLMVSRDTRALGASQDISVEAWIRPARFPARGASATVVSRRGGYALRLDGPRLTFQISGAGPLRARAAPMATKRTVHVVATSDGIRARLFVDGRTVAVRNVRGTSTATRAPLTVGALANGRDAFAGTIDEVALYGRALSPAEVAAHYRAGSTLGD